MAKKEPKLSFKSKADKRSAREDFHNLLSHPAWQRIAKYYDGKIAYLEQVINGDIKKEDGTSMIKTIDELERYRDKRNMAMQFINLPDILIGQEEINDSKPIEFDPFE